MANNITITLPEHLYFNKNHTRTLVLDLSQAYTVKVLCEEGYYLGWGNNRLVNPYFVDFTDTKEYIHNSYTSDKIVLDGKNVTTIGYFGVRTGDYDKFSETGINLVGEVPYKPTQVTKIEITNNISNTTIEPTSIELGKETKITITASDGYHFSSAPTINTNDSTIETTLDSTNKIATATTTLSDTTTEVQINGETVSDPVLISITNNISNTTIKPTSVELGKETTITISADENYSFSEAPTVKINDSTILNTTLSSDKKSATLTNTFDSSTTSISIEGSVNEDEIKLPITLEEYENCTINPTEITLGQRNTLILTADGGASFEKQPYLTTSDGTRKVFTLSDENKTGTLTSYFDKTEKKITLFATAVKSETTDYNPFVAIFVPTLNQIKTLGNIAQINPDSSGDLNLAQYIYGLYKVFIDVPTEKEEKNILLGKYDTSIKAKICNKEILHMYSNSITRFFREDNLFPGFDYPPHCNFKIYLPFIGMMDLDNDTVELIRDYSYLRLHYIFNLLSLKCNAIIELSPTGSDSDYLPIKTWDGVFGYNYPFIQGREFSRLDFNSENIFNFANNEPQIYEFSDRIYNNGNYDIGFPIQHYVSSLNNLVGKGYFELSHVKIPDNSQITDTERDELIRIFGEGVYF